MSITVLVTGKLFADPERRTGSNGKPFTRATLIAHDGEADTFVSVIAFGGVADQVAALRKGDALSVTGRGKVNTWDKAGETKAGLSIVADSILTPYHVQRRREAMRPAGNQ